MPKVVREAAASWEGNVGRGAGAISATSSGTFAQLPYTVASRFVAPEGGTCPEELLAAAHGGCGQSSRLEESHRDA